MRGGVLCVLLAGVVMSACNMGGRDVDFDKMYDVFVGQYNYEMKDTSWTQVMSDDWQIKSNFFAQKKDEKEGSLSMRSDIIQRDLDTMSGSLDVTLSVMNDKDHFAGVIGMDVFHIHNEEVNEDLFKITSLKWDSKKRVQADQAKVLLGALKDRRLTLKEGKNNNQSTYPIKEIKTILKNIAQVSSDMKNRKILTNKGESTEVKNAYNITINKRVVGRLLNDVLDGVDIDSKIDFGSLRGESISGVLYEKSKDNVALSVEHVYKNSKIIIHMEKHMIHIQIQPEKSQIAKVNIVLNKSVNQNAFSISGSVLDQEDVRRRIDMDMAYMIQSGVVQNNYSGAVDILHKTPNEGGQKNADTWIFSGSSIGKKLQNKVIFVAPQKKVSVASLVYAMNLVSKISTMFVYK